MSHLWKDGEQDRELATKAFSNSSGVRSGCIWSVWGKSPAFPSSPHLHVLLHCMWTSLKWCCSLSLSFSLSLSQPLPLSLFPLHSLQHFPRYVTRPFRWNGRPWVSRRSYRFLLTSLKAQIRGWGGGGGCLGCLHTTTKQNTSKAKNKRKQLNKSNEALV